MKLSQNERLYSFVHNIFLFFYFGHFWAGGFKFFIFPLFANTKMGKNFRYRKTSENLGKSIFLTQFFFNVF